MKLRRLFSAFLCVVLLVNACPIVGAAAPIASGNCGPSGSDSVTWELDSNGTLTISGTGDMGDS